MSELPDMRADFEALISAPPYDHNCERWPDDRAAAPWPGQYRRYKTELAWQFWRAALAAKREVQPEPTDRIDNDERTIAYMYGYERGKAAADSAQWLSAAHTLCADAGIPPGHIGDRLESLRAALGKLPASDRRHMFEHIYDLPGSA